MGQRAVGLPGDARGASFIEYIVLLGLVALGCVGAITALGAGVGDATNRAGDRVRQLGASGTPTASASGVIPSCVNGTCKTEASCFVAGTRVQTELGPMPIESLAEGDRVLARDQESGVLDFEPVLRTIAKEGRDLIDLELETTDLELETIHSTADHPYWVVGRGWTFAGNLSSNDRLVDASGREVLIRSANAQSTRTMVYNLEVGTSHTYFVGNHGVLVHNAECSAGFGRTTTSTIAAESALLARLIPAAPLSGPQGAELQRLFGRGTPLFGEMFDEVAENLDSRSLRDLERMTRFRAAKRILRSDAREAGIAKVARDRGFVESPEGERWMTHLERLTDSAVQDGPDAARMRTLMVKHDSGEAFLNAREVYRHYPENRALVLAAFLRAPTGVSFSQLPEVWRDDEEFARIAVSRRPHDIGKVGPTQRFNPALALLAVSREPMMSYYLIPAELRANPEVMIAAVNARATVYPRTIPYLPGTPDERSRVLANMVKKNGAAYHEMTDAERAVLATGITAVSNDGDSRNDAGGDSRSESGRLPACASAPALLQQDPEFVRAAVAKNHTCAQYADPSVRATPEVQALEKLGR